MSDFKSIYFITLSPFAKMFWQTKYNNLQLNNLNIYMFGILPLYKTVCTQPHLAPRKESQLDSNVTVLVLSISPIVQFSFCNLISIFTIFSFPKVKAMSLLYSTTRSHCKTVLIRKSCIMLVPFKNT